MECIRVDIGDLVELVDQEQKGCPRCLGTGIVTHDVGPASDKTWEEKCAHGFLVFDVYRRAGLDLAKITINNMPHIEVVGSTAIVSTDRLW
ncbi:MAG: hypothetical protein ABIL06_13195 [Pseudomonadota bacterium]